MVQLLHWCLSTTAVVQKENESVLLLMFFFLDNDFTWLKYLQNLILKKHYFFFVDI